MDRQSCIARMSVRETSPRESVSQRASVMYASSRTQLKYKQENKREVQFDIARGPVAACDTWDAWDRATRNYESRVNIWED